MATDYIPDKTELYGNGVDEDEYDYTIGHEPELTQEEFSELLTGYTAEINGLKASLASVCGYYSQPGPRDPTQCSYGSRRFIQHTEF